MVALVRVAMGYFNERPHLIRLERCAGVRVEGVTLTNSPMFHLVPSSCEDVVVKAVTITALANPDAKIEIQGYAVIGSK